MAISIPVSLGTAATVATASTQTFNTGAITPAGAKIFVVVGWFDATATLSSITGGSLTWTIHIQGKNGNVAQAICSADAPAGLASGTTITANFSINTPDRFMSGFYATGVAPGNPYATPSFGNAVAGWTSNATTVNAGDILVGGSHTSQASGSPTSGATGGNTEIHDISTADGDSLTTTYQIPLTTSSIAATGTWSGSGWTNRSAAAAFAAAPDATFTPARPLLMMMNQTTRVPILPFQLPLLSGSAAPQTFLQNVIATVTTLASIQKQVNTRLTATATSTASIQKQVNKLLSATATITASIQKQVNKLLATTATSTASIVKKVLKNLTATVTSTASLVTLKVAIVNMTATVTSNASIQKQVNKAVTATATTTATIQKQVNKLVTATATAAGSIQKQINKILAATATTTASLVALKVVVLNMVATVTTAATIRRQVNKNVSATATTTATVSKLVTKTLAATSVVTGVLTPVKQGAAATVTAVKKWYNSRFGVY